MLTLYSFSFFLAWGTLSARRPFVWPHAKGRCNKFEGNARTREASLLLSTWKKYGKKKAYQQPLDLAELLENKLGLQERTYHGDLKSGIHSHRYLFVLGLTPYTPHSETRASRKARLQLPGAARVISKTLHRAYPTSGRVSGGPHSPEAPRVRLSGRSKPVCLAGSPELPGAALIPEARMMMEPRFLPCQ